MIRTLHVMPMLPEVVETPLVVQERQALLKPQAKPLSLHVHTLQLKELPQLPILLRVAHLVPLPMKVLLLLALEHVSCRQITCYGW